MEVGGGDKICLLSSFRQVVSVSPVTRPGEGRKIGRILGVTVVEES